MCGVFLAYMHRRLSSRLRSNVFWEAGRDTTPPTSANDHNHYNKFSTCRSCSYSGPSILSPYWHPCQIYMINFLLGEGGCFPNPKRTHHTNTHAVILCGSHIHYTDNYPLPIIPSISLTDSHTRGSQAGTMPVLLI